MMTQDEWPVLTEWVSSVFLMEQVGRARLENSLLIQHTSALPSVRDRAPQPRSCNDSPTLDLGLGLIPGTVSFETFICNKGSALLL